MIKSLCNGLSRCWRHPTGCARIVLDPKKEYTARQRRKARRAHLWHIILEHYRIGAKWGLDPIPPRWHLQAVLLMESAVQKSELFHRIEETQEHRPS